MIYKIYIKIHSLQSMLLSLSVLIWWTIVGSVFHRYEDMEKKIIQTYKIKFSNTWLSFQIRQFSINNCFSLIPTCKILEPKIAFQIWFIRKTAIHVITVKTSCLWNSLSIKFYIHLIEIIFIMQTGFLKSALKNSSTQWPVNLWGVKYEHET